MRNVIYIANKGANKGKLIKGNVSILNLENGDISYIKPTNRFYNYSSRAE
ncbi:hypothetical protein DFR89_000001 [Clostridium beijerinckii]|nr:hypothetical protein [Clostridium beijerinckii]